LTLVLVKATLTSMDAEKQIGRTLTYAQVFTGLAITLVGLNITVVSYKNRVDFGIVGDREQIDDAWDFLEGAGHALRELEEIGLARG